MKSRRKETKPKRGQKQETKKAKQTLVFDPNERIDFVKGFQKRKQERRERAKQEAAEQEREIRKLLRQKRREALKRAQLANVAGHGNEAADESEQEMKSDEEGGATGGSLLAPPLDSGDIE